MSNAVIRAVGAYAPERVLSNQYFNDLLGEDVDTWLRNNVEIYNRRWCSPEQSTADLCEIAAKQALERAGLPASALDLIIVATDTPEFISPSTAAVVQYRLGAEKAGTFDLNTACAGFVTALDVAAKYIKADQHYRHILVIGGYAMSKYLNMQDKKTVTLFADGAGAVVISADPQPDAGYLDSELITQGQYYGWMGIYAGGAHQPIDAEVIAQHDHQLRFVQRFPKELNADMWTAMIRRLCERQGLTPEAVDHFFITQINVHTIRETMDRLEQPREKAHVIMHEYGYTGSACIPMAFNDAWEKGKIRKNDLLCFIGSGGGLAFASTLFRW